MVVCWVDVLLAKLAPIITGERAPANSTSNFLQSQRYSDSLRAAAQLPESWDDIPQALVSAAMSPAARRLAIRLLYGAFVLSGERENLCEDNAQPADLLPALSAFLDYSEHERANEQGLQWRLTSAMVFALYAVADSHNADGGHKLMRPRTLGRMLQLARTVLHGETIVESIFQPCQVQDQATKLLLRDQIILWCWRTWQDNRVADFETVVAMTAAWLRHVAQLSEDTMRKVEEQPEVCCAAMLHVLHHLVPLIRGDATDLLHIAYRAMYIVNHVCRPPGLLPTQAPEMCRVGLRMLVALKDDEDELRVKDAAIEMLALADVDVLRVALEQARDDPILRFPNSVDEAVSRSRRLLPPLDSSILDDNINLRPVITTVQLLTLIWHSGARGCLIRYTAAHLLALLVERLSSAPPAAPIVISLADAVFTALAAAERAEPRDDEADTAAWTLGARIGHEAIDVAGAFAQYILATKRLPAPLVCAQAADAIRDALLLVMRRHFLDIEEPLALLLAPALCAALMRLTNSSMAMSYYMLSSPWTITLVQELQQLLDGPTLDDYTSVLREQCRSPGKTLLELVSATTMYVSGCKVNVHSCVARRRALQPPKRYALTCSGVYLVDQGVRRCLLFSRHTFSSTVHPMTLRI
ncbi:uncharacterized protein SCHCODRAFT_02146162 [Schizophyllum commune H4-8]|uniref:uncharacterized protein n=1 Tax=Schizophyllum commune (strain H4-8 / FGSC 9210) TaxID=578458 RepID=UPI00215EAD8A|nr:uncharacterized protein SCHCODRAFT_02146162 [Schizophyllum commune H4-8]KAI5897656.1 hypothetical protein SCHCODRAFT_02146162 [Schizophyllum commune H4-8]